MNRLAVAVLALLGVFALAGCAGNTPAPVVTVTAEAPAPAPAANPEADFLGFVGSQIPGVDAGTLLDAGRSVCISLDNGATFDDLARTSVASGLPNEYGAALIAGAVHFLCPRYETGLAEWAASGSGPSA